MTLFAMFTDSISALPVSYWERYGIGMGLLILLGVLVIPRITLFFLLPSFGFFNPFHWIGYVITPRLLALVLGMILYWYTNPVLLCFAAIAWVIVSVIKYFVCQIVLPFGIIGGGMLTAALAAVGAGGLADWLDARRRKKV